MTLQLGSQARLAKIALDARDKKETGYWAGSTWVYHSSIINDADGSGTQLVTITPGEDNEMELLYGSVFNKSGTNRTITIRIRDADDNALLTLYRGVSNSSNPVGWPTNSNSTTNALPAAGQRYILSGLMQLELDAQSVPVSKEMEYSVVARVRGEKPSTTESGQGTAPAIDIKTNRFF